MSAWLAWIIMGFAIAGAALVEFGAVMLLWVGLRALCEKIDTVYKNRKGEGPA